MSRSAYQSELKREEKEMNCYQKYGFTQKDVMLDRKNTLCSLLSMGLVAGGMATAQADCKPPSSMQMQTLFSQIDEAHQNMYNSMDCEGQNMAVKMAEQTCAGKNGCAGQNSCKTKDNSCAGMGSCKGKSPGPFKSKNTAIEIANKMYQKRVNSME
jgi:hypothetical protein